MKDKAILVVSFGTSYKETRRKTLDALTERVAKEFPDHEVRQAFTSKMIIRIMEKRDGIKVDYITDGLRRLKEDGFKDVIVLPTHIIPGYEYDDVREAVSEFRGCFDSVRMGAAMFSCTDDFDIIIDALKGAYVGRCMGSDPEGKAIVFMGHGSDHFANSCYSELQLRLRSKGIDNVFITTVEGFPSTEDTMGMIKDGGFSKVYLIPFLLVAGDHATNDMAGDDDDSLKSTFGRAGYDVECIVEGLLEHQEFQDIYMEHLRKMVSE